MKFFKKIFKTSSFYLLLAICLWQLAFSLDWYSDFFFPSPAQVVSFFWENSIKNTTLWRAIAISLKRLLLGYFVSLIIGIPLGMLCYKSNFLKLTLRKIALGFQTLPSICWVPLTLLWFGQNNTAIIFVVCMGSVWGLIIGTENSIQHIPGIYLKAAYTMGARRLTLLRTVVFPAALPMLITSLKQCWAFAWRSLLSAEIYISTIDGIGLGQLLHYGREMQAMDQVISIILVLIFIGLIIENFVFIPIERSITKRWGGDVF
jgi:NitT/TauT family transport system permease protein